MALFSETALARKSDLAQDWTAADGIMAAVQGWGLFTATSGAPLQIQKMDERDVFTDDAQAWLHVAVRGSSGDPLCVKALRIIERDSPEEHQNIRKYADLHGLSV